MHKENIVYTHNGILISLLKRASYSMQQHECRPYVYYAKWNKPVMKGQILHVSTFTMYLNNQTHNIREQNGDCKTLAGKGNDELLAT